MTTATAGWALQREPCRGYVRGEGVKWDSRFFVITTRPLRLKRRTSGEAASGTELEGGLLYAVFV